jgi:hypothetical protein
MGVSFTCADTEKIPKVLELLKDLFEQIDTKKIYARLINCAKYCRDHTYHMPDEYAAFNVDIVWFLENIIYKSPSAKYPDSGINLLCLELIKEIKLLLLAGFLGTNYPDVEYGKHALGGRGLTFPFPKLHKYCLKSIIESIEYKIFEDIGWKKLLTNYYEHLKSLSEHELAELIKIIEANGNEVGVHGNRFKNLKFGEFIGDEKIKTTEVSSKIATIAKVLKENYIEIDEIYNAILHDVNKSGIDTVGIHRLISLDEFIVTPNKPKWRKVTT